MKINCLSCGHTVNLDDTYDNYEGQIRCCACRALLEIKVEQGEIHKVVAIFSTLPSAVEETAGRAS